MSALDEEEFDDMDIEDTDVIDDPDVINDPNAIEDDIEDIEDIEDDIEDDLNKDDDDDEIDNDEIDNDEIDTDEIGNDEIGNDEIGNDEIGNDKNGNNKIGNNKIDEVPIIINTHKYNLDNKLLHKTKEELIREINKRIKEDYISTIKKNTVLENSNRPVTINIVAPENRITSDFLKKEEMSHVLSVRATHITNYGIPESMLDIAKNETNYESIAILELINKRTPLLLIRKVGDITYEIWNIREELKINSLYLNI
jgi:hypothetical protein